MTELSPSRAALVLGARHAAALLADPAVAQAWERPSALPTWPVSTLAGHLAGVVLNPRMHLEPRTTDPARPALALRQHYRQVQWIGVDPDAGPNVGIRAFSDELATTGPDALVDQVRSELPQLEQWLRTAPPDAVVDVPWTGWALTLDDFAVTRLVELALHTDDLAVSVGLPTTTPAEVTEPVLSLLVQVAADKHGAAALLRALGRTERAGPGIAAF